MAMFVSKEEVLERMEQAHLSRENLTCVYANQLAGRVARQFILAFTNQGITLFYIDSWGKLTGQFDFFSGDSLESYRLKKGLMAYKLIVVDKGQVTKLRINKFMLGVPWHKEGLENLLSTNYFDKKVN